jgi:5-formyltetrahydrofolate cyclo-ligase
LKHDVREELLKRRDAIEPAEKEAKDTSVRQKLFALDEFKNALTVLFYASFRSEVDTIQSIRDSLKTGKRIALPKVDKEKQRLGIYTIQDLSEVSPGYMGIPEPIPSMNREVVIDEIDIVIMPGAGFDIRGNRLGYGAGYYDKLLPRSNRKLTTVALAFEEQIADDVPAEPHDVKVDMIITDKRVIRCS